MNDLFSLDVLDRLLPFAIIPALGFSAGGGVASSDTEFQRQGTSTSTQTRTVPSGLMSLLSSLSAASNMPQSTANNQYAVLDRVMTTPNTSIPSRTPVDNNINMTPTGFEGFSNMARMSGIDPYSSDYEADTQAAYERRAGEALAGLQSGPAAVRGGTERVPLAQGQMATSLAEGRGQEVRNAQVQDATIATNATNTIAQVEAQRRQLAAQAQAQLFAQMFGLTGQSLQAASGVDNARQSSSGTAGQIGQWTTGAQSTTSDQLSGKGSQGSSHAGGQVGLQCCFIFLQALNGILPWYVEMARRDYYTPRRRIGYKKMASWLVPAMQRNRWTAWAVNAVMIRPCLKFARWKYVGRGHGWMQWPVVRAWFAVWDLMGGAR